MFSVNIAELLVVIVAAVECIEYTLKCEGEYSKLKAADCERLGQNTGCYYLEDFFQYRSCASLCNGARMNSLHELKCKDFCSGKYLMQYYKSNFLTFENFSSSILLQSQCSRTLYLKIPFKYKTVSNKM